MNEDLDYRLRHVVSRLQRRLFFFDLPRVPASPAP
jgi:hypothetical protein